MTLLFRDPEGYSKAEEVEDRALGGGSTGIPLMMAIVAGGIGFGLGGPIAGLGLALAVSGQIFHDLGNSARTRVFARRNPGSIAHRIDNDRDMCAWLDAHGEAKVLAQIEQAAREGEPITSVAKRTYKLLAADNKLPSAKIETRIGPKNEAARLQPDPVGQQTRLGAIDVASEPVSDRPGTDGQKKDRFNWSDLNTQYSRFPHLFVVAETGGGKSLLIDYLGRTLDGKITYISTKPDEDERTGKYYLQGWDQVHICPTDYQSRATQLLESFHSEMAGRAALKEADRQRALEGDGVIQIKFDPLVLVLDEVLALTSGLDRQAKEEVTSLIADILQQGRSLRMRLILIGQAKSVKALGIEGRSDMLGNTTFIRLGSQAEAEAKACGLVEYSRDRRDCTIGSYDGRDSVLGNALDMEVNASKPVMGWTCDELGRKPSSAKHVEAPSPTSPKVQLIDIDPGPPPSTNWEIYHPKPKPEALTEYPMLEKIWEYLDRNPDRTIRDISKSVGKGGPDALISKAALLEKFPDMLTYTDGIDRVVSFGIKLGLIKQCGEGFRAVRK